MRTKLFVGCIVLFVHFLPNDLSSTVHGAEDQFSEHDQDRSLQALAVLENRCLDSLYQPEWWSYIWCYKQNMSQVHFDHQIKAIVTSNNLGDFSEEESSATHHVYRNSVPDCALATGALVTRYVETMIQCCDQHVVANYQRLGKIYETNHRTFIASVVEPQQCSYYVTICSELLCKIEAEDSNTYRTPNQPEPDETIEDSANSAGRKSTRKSGQPQVQWVDEAAQSALLSRVRAMFIHGYDSYLQNAYPEVSTKSQMRHTFFHDSNIGDGDVIR